MFESCDLSPEWVGRRNIGVFSRSRYWDETLVLILNTKLWSQPKSNSFTAETFKLDEWRILTISQLKPRNTCWFFMYFCPCYKGLWSNVALSWLRFFTETWKQPMCSSLETVSWSWLTLVWLEPSAWLKTARETATLTAWSHFGTDLQSCCWVRDNYLNSNSTHKGRNMPVHSFANI